GQQTTTHIGYTAHPGLNAGQMGKGGNFKHFRYLSHGCNKILPHQGKADAAPQRTNIRLGGQTTRNRTAMLSKLKKRLEGFLRVRHKKFRFTCDRSKPDPKPDYYAFTRSAFNLEATLLSLISSQCLSHRRHQYIGLNRFGEI